MSNFSQAVGEYSSKIRERPDFLLSSRRIQIPQLHAGSLEEHRAAERAAADGRRALRVENLERLMTEQAELIQEILKNSSLVEAQIQELTNVVRAIGGGGGGCEAPSPDLRCAVASPQEKEREFDMGLFLSGELRVSFRFQLVLENWLQLPLYREKNFSLKLKLVDKDGSPVCNSNRIPLAISVFSPENPPKEVQFNTSGNRMVKGFSEQDLFKGECSFQKIQIKEVTSHFRKGWIYLVISPKGFESRLSCGLNEYVPAEAIKPLVIEKVVVKAKKLPSKEIACKHEAESLSHSH